MLLPFSNTKVILGEEKKGMGRLEKKIYNLLSFLALKYDFNNPIGKIAGKRYKVFRILPFVKIQLIPKGINETK